MSVNSFTRIPMSYWIKSVSRALHCTINEDYYEFRFYAYLMSKLGSISPANVYFLFNPVYMNSTAQHVRASLYDLSINDCTSNWFIITQLILSSPKRCTFKKFTQSLCDMMSTTVVYVVNRPSAVDFYPSVP